MRIGSLMFYIGVSFSQVHKDEDHNTDKMKIAEMHN